MSGCKTYLTKTLPLVLKKHENMNEYKILFSNIGYAKGIDGSLKSHIRHFHRHFYSGPVVQKQILDQVKSVIKQEEPDLCCFVEIDRGSLHSGYYNQLESLLDNEYNFHDISDKYGHNNLLAHMPLHTGKSNAFVSKGIVKFEHLYFEYGQKRLVYKIFLPGGPILFFAHFSLSRKIRALQFQEIMDMCADIEDDIMILADFNILNGFAELEPFLRGNKFRVMNREEEYTFAFHDRQHTLDLCLCTHALAERVTLSVIPQPYSDHKALLVRLYS